MVSKIGFAIAAIIFLLFFYFMLSYIVTQTRSYAFIAKVSAVRSLAQNLWAGVFTSPGIPENWEEGGKMILPGLQTNLYKIPLSIREDLGIYRGLTTLNLTLTFDENCENRTWSTTIRVYEGRKEINSSLYNATNCSSSYLKSAEVVFRTDFSANQTKNFSIYFSSDKSIDAPPYWVDYNTSVNFSFKVFPEERIPALSISKIEKLNSLNYTEVQAALGIEQKFVLETTKVDEPLNVSVNVSLPISPRGNIVVYEAPLLIQDKNGRIKYALASMKIWY